MMPAISNISLYLYISLGLLGLGLVHSQTTTPVPPCVCNLDRLKEVDSNTYWTLILVPAICGPFVVLIACLITYMAVSNSKHATTFRRYFGGTGNQFDTTSANGYAYYPEEAHLIPGSGTYAYPNQIQSGFTTPKGPKMIIASIQR